MTASGSTYLLLKISTAAAAVLQADGRIYTTAAAARSRRTGAPS